MSNSSGRIVLITGANKGIGLQVAPAGRRRPGRCEATCALQDHAVERPPASVRRRRHRPEPPTSFESVALGCSRVTTSARGSIISDFRQSKPDIERQQVRIRRPSWGSSPSPRSARSCMTPPAARLWRCGSSRLPPEASSPSSWSRTATGRRTCSRPCADMVRWVGIDAPRHARLRSPPAH